jgi:hypothetical protein
VPGFPTDQDPSLSASQRRTGGARSSNPELGQTYNDAATNTGQHAMATRVVKKFAPTQAGALKLAHRYGPALVCVRHRHDLEGRTRFTTVELVVEQVSIGQRRQAVDMKMVNIHVARAEYELRRRVRAHGGVWHSGTDTWLLPRPIVKQLGLLGRVISTLP